MSRKRESVSVRIDPETKDRLDDRDDLNLSGLLRGLLEEYLYVGDSVEVALQRRLQEKEEELKELELRKTDIENQIERTERELEDIQHKIQQRRESTPEEVIQFAEKVKAGEFVGDLETSNPAIENKARNAGISPEKFIRLVKERL